MRLLDEGVAAFLQQGYHGTGIKAVLDRVNVPKGSFYNYFESKEEFGAEVVRHYAARLGQELDDALEGASNPLQGLKKHFRNLLRRQEDAGCTGGCLVGNLAAELDANDVVHEALSDAMRGWRNRIKDALAEAQELGTVRNDMPAADLAEMLWDCWEGAMLRAKIEKSPRPMRQCMRRIFDEFFQP